MKIALFSDIHANLPALEAFFADIETQKPDAVYCLGDLVGYNVYPNEIIAEIRKRRIPTIAGNHDLKVIGLAPVTDNQLQASGKNFAYHIISADNRNYLSTLPAHIRLEFRVNSNLLNILLVHGSPRSVNEYILADTDETYILELLQEANADMLCVGHSHKPYHRVIKRDNGTLAHVINIGSVGKPKDGNPMGCYVILDINVDSDLINKDSIEVTFIRFEYNVDQAANDIEKSPLPNELADMLRGAY
ncbi:metallophosphoesterase family protein [Mucilaginibacter sp.]|uniref:metallophosphoesterase family protein n=1 Tax=Mucilaginibacter sp. TaxID=1882438 RepID=UPI002635077E|nr:metallophosphoesterase family protein [Mucilaginibacter sp.]MDB4926804.1 metallophosphoesterase family protein [Mucilaginibacter sp.]